MQENTGTRCPKKMKNLLTFTFPSPELVYNNYRNTWLLNMKQFYHIQFFLNCIWQVVPENGEMSAFFCIIVATGSVFQTSPRCSKLL